MSEEYASRSEVAQLRREVRELRAIVGRLAQVGSSDARIGELLRAIYEFSYSSAWTCSELVADARRAAPALWLTLDQVTGGRGDPCKRLGRFLERYDGIEADGFRLVRVKKEAGSWLYAIEVAGELEVLTA